MEKACNRDKEWEIHFARPSLRALRCQESNYLSCVTKNILNKANPNWALTSTYKKKKLQNLPK